MAINLITYDDRYNLKRIEEQLSTDIKPIPPVSYKITHNILIFIYFKKNYVHLKPRKIKMNVGQFILFLISYFFRLKIMNRNDPRKMGHPVI